MKASIHCCIDNILNALMPPRRSDKLLNDSKLFSSMFYLYKWKSKYNNRMKINFSFILATCSNETELYQLFCDLSTTDKSLSIWNSNNFNFLRSLLSWDLNAFILSNYYLLSVLMFYHGKTRIKIIFRRHFTKIRSFLGSVLS